MQTLCIIILLIAIIAFVVLMSMACYGNSLSHKQYEREMSYDPNAYQGPAGEPQWHGTLPDKVDDYTQPRYVYENLVESTDFLPENGRIIGYRISPSLVIHSRVQEDVNPPIFWDYIERLGGKLLQDDEIVLLQRNWNEISKLRQQAGDEPLKTEYFWAQIGIKPVAYHFERRCYKDVIGVTTVWYPLILKR